MGVSMPISYVSGPQPINVAAVTADSTTVSVLVFFFFGAGPVIDFLEELEVLLDLGVVGLEGDGFFVRLASFVQLSLVFVGDCEVVEGRRVGRVEFDGLLPAIN